MDDELDWDFSYIYAENEGLFETKNYGRFDRWAIAVDPAACAADADCPGTLNPFFEFGSITPEQMAYLSTGSLKDIYSNRMEMLSRFKTDILKWFKMRRELIKVKAFLESSTNLTFHFWKGLFSFHACYHYCVQ